ncbi:MAG: hypothetical protein Q9M36_02340 [Sulfurovum sp.]|nr:hypothetical protein [Sulfurovum sp.]
MKKYLLVEGITDVALVKYICVKKGITKKYNDFEQNKNYYTFNDLIIVNLKGEKNLDDELKFLKTEEMEVLTIGILQDADKNIEKSKKYVEDEIKKSNIDKNKFIKFYTPNNKDVGNLEILLLSTLYKENIPQLQCFQAYKTCLDKHINIEKKEMDKGELYAYTMFAKDGKKTYTPQDSFMYKPNNRYNDTGLWDLSKKRV